MLFRLQQNRKASITRMSEGRASRVYFELRRRIVMNELAPGTAVTELGVGSELGCSQASVREAMLRLQGEGLVLRSGRQGTTVTELDADTAAEMLDLRRRLELRGVRRAVRRVGPADLTELRGILELMERAGKAGDAWGVVQRDMEFHLALFAVSGLYALAPVLERCILHTYRVRLWSPWRHRPLANAPQNHREILLALEGGDITRLTRSLGTHLDTTVDRAVEQVNHAVHPEMEEILAEMRLPGAPAWEEMPLLEGRALFRAGQQAWNADPPACARREATIGGVPCRVLNETPDRPTIVFVHGGGWTFGSPDTYDRFARVLALAAGMTVVMPDYRLAPEHPCPAAIEDVIAVWRALPAGRKVLCGDSAGANIALAVAQLGDVAGVRPDMLSLWYGCYAPIFDTRSHREFGGRDPGYGLTSARMRWYWDNWLGSAKDPRAAPLDGPIDRLGPAHLVAAGLDCLRDDTLILSGKMAAAGVPYRLDVVPGVVHGFLGMTARLGPARETLEMIASEIRKTVN